MGSFRFKLNRAGVGELLKSQEAANVCTEFANAIRDRCGEGYEVSTQVGGKTRSNASVMAVTVEARRENLENNTLEKAIR
ncbi:MAG: hypothetical protein Q4F78_07235 [Bacillota bacterium]|nr:hypothetical protein [Bacillota bacterium]